MKKKKESEIRRLSRGWNGVFTFLLCLVGLMTLAPMILILIVSFSSEASISMAGYSFFPLEWSLDGYRHLLKMGDQLLDSYIFTIFYSVVGTILSVFVMSMAAYVISVKEFSLRRPLTWYLFFTMLFGGGLVPSYILNARYLKIDNSIWIFLLPGLCSVYHVIILRTFIQTNVPEALLDSAKIDGAGHFTIFFRIILPLSKAGVATVALFTIVGKWNDWFTGMLYVENPKLIPLQTLLTKLQKNVDYLKQNAELANTPDGLRYMRNLPQTNLRMACTIIAIVPILCAYPFFQRYFVQGLTMGSIKE